MRGKTLKLHLPSDVADAISERLLIPLQDCPPAMRGKIIKLLVRGGLARERGRRAPGKDKTK